MSESKPILDIWEKPVKYPRRQVRAWVGSFASDCLGDYKTPRAAISAAKRYGYRTLHIIYRDGTSQVFDTQQGRGGVVTDDPTNSQRGSWAFAGETKTHTQD